MNFICFVVGLVVACGYAVSASAQAYPSRPVTIIVPFPAGGPTDTLGRILSERMRVSLGQPVSAAACIQQRSILSQYCQCNSDDLRYVRAVVRSAAIPAKRKR